MSEPIRITKNASASDLSECLGWLGDEIEKRAAAQTREEVADALRDSFIDRSQTLVKYSDTPDESIVEAGRLQVLADRFDSDGVPADFRLGLEFAIAMIRDKAFEL